jgi:uncharacterized protein
MVPLHRVRFAWGAGRAIDVECIKGEGLIVPPVGIPDVSLLEQETKPDEFAARGIPAIGWRDDVPPLFEPFQLRENTEYYIDVTLPLTRAEAQTLSIGSRAWPFADRLASLFLPDPPRRWTQTPEGHVVISGQLRLKNHAGILDLRTAYDTPLIAEVVCRKINYLDEFQTLLNEVAEQLAELLLQYDSPLSFAFDLTDTSNNNEAALLFQMRHMMSPNNLPTAIDEVLTSFHSKLVERTSAEAISGVEEPQIDTLIDELDMGSLGRGGPLARLFRGYTPRELAVEERYETFDTLENRYVKYFLEECLLIAQRLAQQLEVRRKPAAVREARYWAVQIEELLGHSRWSEVGSLRQFPSNSQVLQKRRGYKDVLKFDLSLRLGLELSWPRGEEFAYGLLGDVRPVNEIYEYWCFFVLRRLLAEMCEAELPGNGSFIVHAADGLQVRLEKGKRSRVSFLYKSTGTRRLQVCLFYNRRFKRPSRPLASWDGSYTAFFDPDYSVLVTVTDGDSTRRHWLHFDAKYRLEMAEVENLFASSELPLPTSKDEEEAPFYDAEISRIHKQDDLFKMHTYRDGILSSRGAYILFPGDGAKLRLSGKHQNLFVRHPSAFGGAPAQSIPSVGAFDLCPGRDLSQLAVIREFLRDVFDAMLTNTSYQEEAGFIP